jgi:hypothetical protein
MATFFPFVRSCIKKIYDRRFIWKMKYLFILNGPALWQKQLLAVKVGPFKPGCNRLQNTSHAKFYCF